MGDDGGVVGGADGADDGRAGRRQDEAEYEKPRHRGFLPRDDAKLGRVVYRFDLPLRGHGGIAIFTLSEDELRSQGFHPRTPRIAQAPLG